MPVALRRADCPSRRCPALDADLTASSSTGVGGTGVVTDRRHPRHGRPSRGQGLRHDRHGRPRPEGRRGVQPRQACAGRRRTSTPSASPRARPTWCSAATSPSPARRRCLGAIKHGGLDRRRQHGREHARRFHPQRRFLAADRAAEARRSSRPPAASRRISSMRRRLATALSSAMPSPPTCSMLGYGWQFGAVPLSRAASIKAIELNGEAVAMNHAGLRAGPSRRAPIPGGAGAARSRRRAPTPEAPSSRESLDEIIAAPRCLPHRLPERRLWRALSRISSTWRPQGSARSCRASTAFTETVARYSFKLMAYKDEYEVARLYADGSFLEAGRRDVRRRRASGSCSCEFHLAPPLMAKVDPNTGLPRKTSFGPWMMGGLRSAGEAQGSARHAASTSSATPRSANRAPADRRLRSPARRAARQLSPENHALCGRAGRHPGEDPRLRPRQGAAFKAAKAEEAALAQLREGVRPAATGSADQPAPGVRRFGLTRASPPRDLGSPRFCPPENDVATQGFPRTEPSRS